jgi:hypothetical protein
MPDAPFKDISNKVEPADTFDDESASSKFAIYVGMSSDVYQVVNELNALMLYSETDWRTNLRKFNLMDARAFSTSDCVPILRLFDSGNGVARSVRTCRRKLCVKYATVLDNGKMESSALRTNDLKGIFSRSGCFAMRLLGFSGRRRSLP